jgi:hypothetical protein
VTSAIEIGGARVSGLGIRPTLKCLGDIDGACYIITDSENQTEYMSTIYSNLNDNATVVGSYGLRPLDVIGVNDTNLIGFGHMNYEDGRFLAFYHIDVDVLDGSGLVWEIVVEYPDGKPHPSLTISNSFV